MKLDMDALMAGLPAIAESPSDVGTVEMIVCRPAVDERVVLSVGKLEVDEGLVGDGWKARGSRHTDDGSAQREAQITLMNARAAALIAGDRERWPLAGDQFFVDLDLSGANLPVGTRIQIGGSLVEVTAKPHTGCSKFVQRFGADAMRFVNTGDGRAHNLRGIYVHVVEAGDVKTGDAIRVLGRS